MHFSELELSDNILKSTKIHSIPQFPLLVLTL